MSRMFPFITETWNPFTGRCPYMCSYCWARGMANRYKHQKYLTDEHGIDEKQIGRKFKPGSFIFVQDMNDASTASLSDVARVMTVVKKNPEVTFLFLVKNPTCYLSWVNQDETRPPPNTILGATIESNNGSILRQFSKAPPPFERFTALWDLNTMGFKTFVSIEPVMDFDLDKMFQNLLLVDPWAVAIGYDNYHNGLIEPPLNKVKDLITELEGSGIKVYRKTVREPNEAKDAG